MTTEPAQPSPLAAPEPWDLVADGYITDTVPLFERYAGRALELAELAPHSWVLDVACGPGTLSLLAARAGHRVNGLDFAPTMIERLRTRAQEAGLSVEAAVGDGQNLPYPDASFEAAFSMFGVIFFPDRVQGLCEMARVLRPGGRVVISSWVPTDRVPVLQTVMQAIREQLPGLPFGNHKAPLGEPEEMRDEMSSAGLREVEIHEVTFESSYPSVDAFWESFVRGGVPFVLLKQKLGAAGFAPFSEGVKARMREQLGAGPLSLKWPANMGVGQKR